MEEPHLHKIFTGKVEERGEEHAEEPMERSWQTAMFKKERAGEVWLSKTGLDGDEVVNEKIHGGSEKAVFTYPIKHYTYWQTKYERDDFQIGTMGENFAVLEMDEFTVCIGDIVKVGDAVLQVSQPRKPYWHEARRFKLLDLALEMQRSGRTGWFYRVLEEGNVQENSSIELIERPYPQWSIQAVNEIMYVYKDDLRLADDLATCDLLASNWINHLKKRLIGQEPRISKRVYGPNKG